MLCFNSWLNLLPRTAFLVLAAELKFDFFDA